MHHIPEFSVAEWLDDWLTKEGGGVEDQEIHDSYAVSAMLAAFDPELIRAERRQPTGQLRISGVPPAPLEKTQVMGRKLINKHAQVAASRKSRESKVR